MPKAEPNFLYLLLKRLLIFPIFLVLFSFSVIVHELGHIIAALTIGVTPNDLIISWWPGRGPGVTVPPYFPQEYFAFYRYAGGVTSGLVFLVVYAILWNHALQTKTGEIWNNLKWWIGMLPLIVGIFQIYNGLIEGGFFELYITRPALMSYGLLIAGILSLVFHICLTFFVRKFGKSASTLSQD